jgi:hypothetical protein
MPELVTDLAVALAFAALLYLSLWLLAVPISWPAFGPHPVGEAWLALPLAAGVNLPKIWAAVSTGRQPPLAAEAPAISGWRAIFALPSPSEAGGCAPWPIAFDTRAGPRTASGSGGTPDQRPVTCGFERGPCLRDASAHSEP